VYDADELEFGGLSAESRVWVEMGAPIDPPAWKEGRAWLKDQALWLSRPNAAYFSWRLRRYPRQQGLEDVERQGIPPESAGRVRAYWRSLSGEDAAWRRRWRERFPVLSADQVHEAFQTVMDASLRAAGAAPIGGEYSPWMADLLEALPNLKPGEDFALPSTPALKDLRLLAYLEYETAVYQLDDGRWLARKGTELTVPLDDRRGRLRALYHNHPAHIQSDPLGAAPSSRDFYDDEAPVLGLITAAALTRYKMPPILKDPRTGEDFDPRALSFAAFRERIYGEAGTPYKGKPAREAIKDPAAFYRRLGMDVSTEPWR
ncbi:MAG: hypothetical protein ACHQ2Z_16370, partial [Elusimicrobiota bacterium]